MPADLVTRLLLKNDDFDRELQRSKTQLQTFEKGIGSLKSGMLAFAGGIGVAMTAGEAFNKVINSSQTLSDGYNRTIEGITGTVDNFFYSISNGDWTPFLQGLSNTISLAREAYNAMDQLGNTKISYGYFNMKNQAGLQDQIAILKDKNATPEQKALARAEADRILADQKEITDQLSKRSFEAMKALVQKSTGFSDLDVSQMDMEKPLRLDVSYLGDEEKARLDTLYKDFEKRAAEIKKLNTTTQTVYAGMAGYKTEYKVNQGKLREDLKPLLKQYQDAIIYNATLKKESDEWLKILTQIGMESFVADRTYAGMVKTKNRATQSETGGFGKKEDAPVKGSLAFINKEISDLEKKLQAASDVGTRAGIRNAISELKKQKFEIELEGKSKGSLDYINTNIAHLTKELETTTDTATRAGINRAIEKLNKEKHAIELEAEIKPIENTAFKNIKSKNPLDPKNIKIKPLVDNTAVITNQEYAESLQAIGSVMGSLSQITNEGAAAWLSYGSNLMSAVASAIPAIMSLTAARKGEATANAEAGVTGAIASVSSIPVVGWIMALSAGAAVIAAMASIPKFASGGFADYGVVPGSLVSGDRIPAMINAGEMILNRSQQGNLFKILNAGGNPRSNVNVVGEVRITGDQMKVLLSNAEKVRRRGL